jgi:hypothetical protein
MTIGPKILLARYFYLGMGLLLTAIVFYGFSHTVEANLLHPSFPRPVALYLHAAVFGGWMILFVVQSALVAAARRPQWHRKLGWLGFAMGCAMPVLGMVSALRMTHLRSGFGDTDDVAFLVLALIDMAAFAALFALAILWRGQPETHRRLMFTATCGLCVAALTRFPPWLPGAEGSWAYAYVDGLIALGAVRDLIVLRRVHPVYLWALPCLMAAQLIGNLVYITRPAAWMSIAYALIR